MGSATCRWEVQPADGQCNLQMGSATWQEKGQHKLQDERKCSPAGREGRQAWNSRYSQIELTCSEDPNLALTLAWVSENCSSASFLPCDAWTLIAMRTRSVVQS